LKKGISFCVLTHNRATLLRNLITDLRRQIMLLGNAGEIIIHDDASTDSTTIDLLAHLETEGDIQVMRKDHMTEVPESWAHHVNLAFTLARFEVVVHLDDDVHVHCDSDLGWAQSLASCLEAHPKIGVLCPQKPGFFEPTVNIDSVAMFPGISEPCFAMRRETFLRLGPMDTSLRWLYGPDYAVRVLLAGLACGFHPGCRQIDLCPDGLTATDYKPDRIPFGRRLRDKWGIVLDRPEFWPYQNL
jgi:glycosyltransferase involved in cell wall biosynthesis